MSQKSWKVNKLTFHGISRGEKYFFVVSTLQLFLCYLEKLGHNEKSASRIFLDLSKAFDTTKRNIWKFMNPSEVVTNC